MGIPRNATSLFEPVRRPLRWGLPVLAGVLALSLALWALLHGDGSLQRVQQAGVLRVGYAVEVPYAMAGRGGVITGESPEVARRIAARLGVARVEWIQTAFSDLIAQLLEGRFDMIASGLFITPERAGRVRYSEPTLQVRPGWLTTVERAAAMTSYEAAARRTGLRLAVLHGAVEQSILQRLGGAVLLETPDAQTALAAVLQGNAEALALSLPTVRSMAALYPEQLTAVAVSAPAHAVQAEVAFVAFAFRPQDAGLLQAWNDAQSGFIGSADHLAVVAAFGFAAADLPGAVTTAQVLAR